MSALAALLAVSLAAARTPAPLPEPLPEPGAPGEQGAVPAAPPPGVSPGDEDPLETLWSHRLALGRGGAPLVTIRILEGAEEVAFRPRAAGVLRFRGGGVAQVAAGDVLRVRAREALPAALAQHPLLAELPYSERERVAAVEALWSARGATVKQRLVGGVYGIAGHVIDNRRVLLLADTDGSAEAARAFADHALEAFGTRTETFTEVVRRPSARLEVRAGGEVLGWGEALVTLDAGAFALVPPERGASAPAAAEGRVYRGALHVTVDATGRLAAVLAISLEELLRGIVPSEIPAGAAPEALRAQAVTARSNVLAQLGTRHLDEPWVLCSEVHCQAYRGAAAEAPSTDAAVRDTAGEALFGKESRALVDGVYSAMCGGHGEDNDAVWPVLPDPSLRGRPDAPPGSPAAGDLSTEPALRAFLASAPRAYCARAHGAPLARYRWQRRLAPDELDRLTASLAVGHVRALVVGSRGVSGRARVLTVEGERGRAVVEGELRIRRLLGDLPSAMFVVEREGDDLILRGGGWGHGVGLCQWGAIGRAEAGQGYRQILRAYFGGAEVARVY